MLASIDSMNWKECSQMY